MAVKIGLVGTGTVGGGCIDIIQKHKDDFLRHFGVDIELARVCSLSSAEAEAHGVGHLFTDNFNNIINDPEIDIVVELIGGTTIARTVVLNALAAGKNVVTANKALMATHGKEVMEAAEAAGKELAFEASVGGGIPIIDPLKHSLIANEITSVMGIVNGTTNYMLTRMADNGLSYEDEAYLFALQSGESKDVAFNTRLRALMISGSQEATDFRAHTAQAGFQLADGAGSATKNTIAAIAKAYRLYKEYGPEQYVQILQLIADTWNGAAWSVTGYLLGGVAVFLREYGEEYSRGRFIKRLRSATYETLRDEARRQQRGSSDVAHALAVTKLYNLTGGRGTVDPRRLTVLD